MSAIEGKGLRKAYSSDGTAVVALDDVDLAVGEGEFAAVMGPSGSGKSTLLHVLGGLDTPDEGEVRLGGRRLADLSRSELAQVRRRDVGFVFQFFNLVPTLSVEENVCLPAILDHRPDSEYRDHLEDVLRVVGLAERRGTLPSELSGGEQQRVAIARSLVNRPAVVLADEPTGNLDRSTGVDVMTLLRRLNGEGQTIVVVTHDPTVASFARRVLFMRDGRLVDEAHLEAPGETSSVLSRLVQLED